MLQGGVDLSYLRWKEYDGVGRDGPQRAQLHRARLRPARRRRLLGPRPHRGRRRCSRATSTGTQLFGEHGQGARWFHTGGVFCALSESTPAVAHAAMEEAHAPRHAASRTTSTTATRSGGRSAARRRRARSTASLMPFVDVLFGNEEDFSAALGFELEDVDAHFQRAADGRVPRDDRQASWRRFPTSRRSRRRCAPRARRRVNGWGAICWHEGQFYEVPQRDVEILDRVGGGDSFASGFIYGLLARQGSAVGARVRRRPRRAGDVDARRHHDGDVRRGDARDEGRRHEDRSMSAPGDGRQRAEICRRIEEVGIVPVVRAPSPELAMRAAEAVLAGGISIFEITMTVPNAPAVIRALVDAVRRPRASSARARCSTRRRRAGLHRGRRRVHRQPGPGPRRPSPPRTRAACRSCPAR